MVQIGSEDRRKQYRKIYELLWETPRVTKTTISKTLGVGRGTVERRMKEAFEKDYIVGPDIRKKSFKNLKEYMYFIRCEDSDIAYLKYRKKPDIIYHAETIGFCDLWVISKKRMKIEGEILLEGYRSDYHVSYAPDHPWETGLQNMRGMIKDFNPDDYRPQGIIQTHFNKTIEWDKEDKILYRYFKHNLRRKFSPIFDKYQIHSNRIYRFLERLPDCCTIATSYYPDTLSAYDPYLFMFETDYEDFIIDLFSELPTSVSFFKVSGKLFVLAYISKPSIRSVDLQVTEKWYLPLLILELSEKKIIKSKTRAIVDYFWGKNL